ncbi:RagB/SusD family nutrient uptake outer membrane protein [Saccharicrinis fermentans]|uniref:SusD family protein n=1 Tax=Saccharicrinis fermentans DSM 9555 = JCM 21142 TaxID=869213 RepID=W7YCI2_9BACT|nr:RagB/SusD family nutrient uptake outer membrane protein [Saccharicrinis fermentans]GAF02161.1 SusD family protein [Saccharicrinis fermentans DSM 9555 = JCM 21142]
MTYKLFKYLALVVVLALTVSCNDWLEETNPNQSDSDSYWKNLTQTDGTLIATYGSLFNHGVLNIREEAWRSDMGFPGYGRPSYSGDGVVWYNQIYTNTNTYITKKWESLYLGIFRANQVIDGLKGLEGSVDNEEWEEQMAQARFLRGLFHFYLHSSFNKGNIIIRDFVPKTTAEYNIPVSASAEVIAFFRSDLRYAYEHLPVSWADEGEIGRATKGAAATILGTSFLYENEIDSAIVKFEDVVNNVSAKYGYELVQDPSLLFTTAGEFNKESIFEIAYSNEFSPEYNTWVEDRTTNRLAADSYANTSSSFFPSCWITWEYLNEPMDSKDSRNYYLSDPEDPASETLRDVPLRASSMIALIQDEQSSYYGKKVWEKATFNIQNGFARYKKYTNHDLLTDENDNPGGRNHSGKNVTVNRLGDVYLMLAECYIKKDDVKSALDLINAVRSRWGLQLIGLSNGDTEHEYNEVSYDAQSLMERLMNIEKPLETSVEGHAIRWFDLRRWGKLEENFKKKANEVYWSDHYTPKDQTKTKWNSTLTAIDPGDSNRQVYKDYEQAAMNFNYELHAWLPIPATEEVSNPNLYK